MGNTSQNTPSNQIPVPQYIISDPHLMLTNCKIISKANLSYIKSEWPFYMKSQFQQWQKKYKNYIRDLFNVQSLAQTSHFASKLLLLPKEYQYVQLGMCSPTGKVTLVYDFFQQTLIKEIEHRSYSNCPFAQHKLWKLLYQLCNSASFLHTHNKFLGDVRSQNIFTNKQQKTIQIVTQVSWIGQLSLSQKIKIGQNVFLSPQLLLHINKNGIIPFNISSLNDGFSIGLTLAQCILLQDLSKIYEYSSKEITINQAKHQQVIQSLLKIQYYPLKLLLIVIGMIQFDSKFRFSCEEVVECLQDFKQSINKQESFVLSKQLFIHHFPFKFNNLQLLMKNQIHAKNQQMFKNGQLSISRIYTINGCSTVQMVKRNDETFNLDIFDTSSNNTAKIYKISQVQSIHNKSWTNQLNNHKKKTLSGNILDQFYLNPISHKPISHQHENQKGNQTVNYTIQNLNLLGIKTGEGKFKKGELFKLAPIMVESHVKQLSPFQQQTPQGFLQKPLFSNKEGLPAQPQTIQTQAKQDSMLLHSPQLKILNQKYQIEDNFSFHSPQSRARKQQLNQSYKDANNISIDEHRSIKRSESIIIPNVYLLSEPPESYVSYKYSKSISQNPIRQNFDLSVSDRSPDLSPIPYISSLHLKKSSDVCDSTVLNSLLKQQKYIRCSLPNSSQTQPLVKH